MAKKKKRIISPSLETEHPDPAPEEALNSPAMPKASPTSNPPSTPEGFRSFLSSLKTYNNSDAFSDVVVQCEDQKFKAHRVILSAHSNYFAKELNGDWKESSERSITIKDFDPSVVEGMLYFMYSFAYSNTYGTSSMVYDAQIYQIADRYHVMGLKEYSKDRFRTAITAGWSMDDFPLAISVVYESTPQHDRGLRDLAVETSRKNIDSLLGTDGFNELLRKTPDFSADLIPFLRDNSAGARSYSCPSCGADFRADFTTNGSYYCPHCGSHHSNWSSFAKHAA